VRLHEETSPVSHPLTNAAQRPLVSVVVPIYNEEEVLHELRERLEASLNELPGGYEIVYVDDGSTDGSAEIIAGWARSADNVVLVQLSRNFGMDIAMSAGLDHTNGSHVALMHADLQDPPELIPEMLHAAEAEDADVVFARRIGRDESRTKRVAATAFYAMMRRLARVPYQGQAGDFRLMSRRVVEAVRRMPERRRFLRGMVAWVGFRQVPIEYRRAGRKSGGGVSYRALFRMAFEALTSFSDVPLSLATYVGALAASLSGLAGLTILLLTILGALTASVGIWILVAVLFLGGVQLMSVGVLGRYIAHVHEQVLDRPLYLVSGVIARGEEQVTARPRAVSERST
jgi:glycosyltransferase involved in cell wall biosynthesis